jgi:hypothetical protein
MPEKTQILQDPYSDIHSPNLPPPPSAQKLQSPEPVTKDWHPGILDELAEDAKQQLAHPAQIV